jgi:hypothetical protein
MEIRGGLFRNWGNDCRRYRLTCRTLLPNGVRYVCDGPSDLPRRWGFSLTGLQRINFSRMSKMEQTGHRRSVKPVPSPARFGIYPVTESFCNAPAQRMGSIMTSSQQFLTAIERPRCSRCQARMMLERVSPGPIGFEHRLFECPRCDHVEMSVIASDPFKSKAIGWLSGELRTPN